jgi:hypothetical protein
VPADDVFVASALWTHAFANASDAGQVRDDDDDDDDDE